MRLKPPIGVVRTAESIVKWALRQKDCYTPLEAVEALRDMLEDAREEGVNQVRQLQGIRTLAFYPGETASYACLHIDREMTMVRSDGDALQEALTVLGDNQAHLPF